MARGFPRSRVELAEKWSAWRAASLPRQRGIARAGTGRQPDQCLRLGRGEKNNRIGIGSRTGLTDGDDRKPADDEIANTLLLEKREGEQAEGIETAC